MRPLFRSLLAVFAVVTVVATALTVNPHAASASTQYTDTTSSDFDAGFNEDIAINDDGSLALAPGSTNFNSTGLPSGWSFTPTTSGSGSAAISNGQLVVDGGMARTGQFARLGQSMTLRATFGNAAYQEIGFINPNNVSQKIYVGTASNFYNNLYIGNAVHISNTPIRNQTITLRIDAGATSTRVWKMTGSTWDPTPIYQSGGAGGLAQPLALYARDQDAGGPSLSVDVLNSQPYSDPTEDFDAPSTWQFAGPGTPTYTNGVMAGYSFAYGQSAIGPNSVADMWATLGVQALGGAMLISPADASTYAGFQNGPTGSIGNINIKVYKTGASPSNVFVGPSVAGVMHHFRIEWYPDRFVFSIPDVPSFTPVTVNTAITQGMSPKMASADVDSFYVASLAGSENQSGTFTSRVFDAGDINTRWQNLSWNANVPANTSAQFSVRTGNTATPDGTWSSFVPVATSGGTPAVSHGRYAQYRVSIMATTSTFDRPSVQDVTLTSAPASHAGFVDTTVSDFSAGTLGTTTTTSTGNGEVTLPHVFADFNGTLLPAGWSGSGATVHDGMVSLDGGSISNGINYNPGTTIEFSARIAGNASGYTDMRAGWNGAWYWGCPGYNSICLRTYPNYYSWQDAPAPTGQWARYRITFTATQTIFYVNGSWVATQGPTGNSTMTPSFWDVTSGYGTLDVDWVSITSFDFPSTQTFTSRVFDAGENVCWGNLTWDASAPLNSKVAMKVRTGNTPTPDSSWTSFRNVYNSGDAIKQTSRYVQYSADLTANQLDAVPSLNEVVIGGGDFGPCASITDTTQTDFDSGTGSNVFSTGNGDLVVPVGSTDFPGTTLPGGWKNHTAANPFDTSQGAFVSNNVLTVNNAEVVNENSLSAGHSLEFTATFHVSGEQQAGFGSATFVAVNGELRTSTGPGGDYALWGGSYLYGPHRYRVDWVGNSASFYVDGNLLATHPAPAGNRNIRFYDDAAGGVSDALTVSDVDIDTYAASGTHTSRVVDEGASVAWANIDWDADVPSGTSLTVEVRTGNTPVPDGSWSSFAPVADGGAIGATSRYLQYRVSESTTTTDTVPTLHSLTLTRS